MFRVRLMVALSAAALVVAGCTTSGSALPEPTTAKPSTGTAATTTDTTTSTSAPPDNPALDGCDVLGIMPCARQVARISLPIAGTSIALTYSSDRAAGRTQDFAPSAADVGLGGWTLSVVDTFDPATKRLISGIGNLRSVHGVAAGASTAVANAGGTTVDLFDAKGRVTSVMDATTGAALETFAWGAHGLNSISDTSGLALTVVRAADGTPVALSVPKGATTGLGTVKGQLAAVVYPDGSRAKVATEANGLVDDWSTATGAVTQYSYDEQGRLAGSVDAAGARTSYQRELSGNTLTVTTDLPTQGQTVDSVTAADSTTTWSHTDPTGAVSTLAASGDQQTLTGADGTKTASSLTPDPRWGMDAPLPALTRGTQIATATAGASPVSRTVTIGGHAWKFGYDPATRTATTTNPLGATTEAGYDAQGRVVTTGSGGVAVAYTYGMQGRITSITVGTGTDARTWTYAYAGSLVTVTDPLGQVSRRSLSPAGSITAVAGPGSSGFSLTRDSADRVTAFAAPVGGTYQLTWGAGGKIAAINAPSGQGAPQFTGYDYDKSGNLIKQFTSNTALTITRDAAGRIGTYDAGSGPVAAAYDSAGRLTTLTGTSNVVSDSYTGPAVTGERVAGPISSSVTRTLDASGRTASLAVAGGPNIAYAYDAASRVDQAGDLTIQRDGATGLVTSQKLGSLTATFTRNQFGEQTQEHVTGAGGATVADVVDTRDKLGRVTAATTTAGGRTSRTTYTYDTSGRLAAETIDGATTGYTYDAAGNITAVTDSRGVVTKYVYDGRNALIQQGDDTFTYDGAGQLATETSPAGTTTHHYDGAGRLLSVAAPGKPDIAYSVDGFGRRIATSVGGKVSSGLAYLDAQRPVAQLDPSGKVTREFVYSGSSLTPDYLSAAGVDYLEVPDASGGPALVVGAATGAIADRVVRTALGGVVSETAPGFQAIGFAGGITDAASGLVRFGARDYDPSTGRWTAPDPLSVGGGSANLYQYVNGDPVDQTDPSGRCDYTTISVTGAAGAGFGGSGTLGLVFTEGGVGVYGTVLGGPGLGGGLTLDFGCSDSVNDNTPSPDDIGGPAASGTGGFGPVGVGGDLGFSDDGPLTTVGGHVSFGVDVGASGGVGYTGVLCIFGCGGDPNANYGVSSDDNNPNADGVPDCPGGICDPNGSDAGPPDGNPTNACDGGDCSDPADSNPDLPSGTGPQTTGDPHLRTADGLRYDLQAVGEFTWLTSVSGDFDVQVRQQPFRSSRTVSLTTAVAMTVDGDRLMITLPGGNLQPIAVTSTSGAIPAAGRFVLPHGDVVRLDETRLSVTLPDGTKLWVTRNPYGLNVNASLAQARKGKVSGIAGPFTGGTGTIVQTRNGQSLTQAQLADHHTRYHVFGDSWRISQSASLFTDDPGRDATAFDDPSFPQPNPPAIPPTATAAATAICAQLDLPPEETAGCVEDVALTGDAGFASSLAFTDGTVPGAAAGTTAAPAGGLTPGQTVSGTITAGGKDTYALSVTAGTVGYFAAATDCKAATGPDLQWYFTAPDGGTFTGSDDVCSDQGRVLFPTTGTYHLVVGSTDGASGPYSLAWRTSRPDRTRTLTAGSTATGDIDLPGAHDVYQVSVAAGTVGYFAAAPGCNSSTDHLRWYFDTPDGGSYTGSDNICDDQGRVEFAKAGTYQLVVVGEDYATGAYSLSWRTSRPDLVKSILAGGTVSGTIDLPGAHDVYTLAATAGTVGYFAAAAGCTAASGGSLRWYFDTPDGYPYVGSDDICTDQGRVLFTKTGVYQLVVVGTDAATGPYSITWRQSRPDLTRPLVLGSTSSGTIDRPGAHDIWTFTAAANSSIKFTAAAGCSSKGLHWAVQTGDGYAFAGSEDLCSDLGVVSFPKAGLYQVVVYGDDATTGAYSFDAAAG